MRGDRRNRTGTRIARDLIAVLAVMVLPLPGWAQHGQLEPGFTATCWIQESNGRGNVYVRAHNGIEKFLTLSGVTAAPLNVSTTGTAALDVLTIPSFRRDLSSGNHVTFKWAVQFTGCGTVSLSTEVTAEDPNGITLSTGPADCGEVTLSCESPTPTRTPSPTWTPPPTRTPRTPPTVRPTSTPLPTRTPRTPPTLRPTSTPLPTRTPRSTIPPPETRTPIPTNTPPIVTGALAATCSAVQVGSGIQGTLTVQNNLGVAIESLSSNGLIGQQGSGTARVAFGAAVPDRFSNVGSGSSRRFRLDGTVSGEGHVRFSLGATASVGTQVIGVSADCEASLAEEVPTPTRTPRTPPTLRPTSTPLPTRTPRTPAPTRTPLPTWTATPPAPISPESVATNCSLIQRGERVSVMLHVANATGGDLTNLTPGDLNVQTEGAAHFFLLSGPAPRAYGRVRSGSTAIISWSGRVNSAGAVGISVSASWTGPDGAVASSGDTDCGVVTVEAPPEPPFDPAGFFGRCVARNAHSEVAGVTFEVINNTGGDLTDVIADAIRLTPTGTVEVVSVEGPKPALLPRLFDRHQRSFTWQVQATGEGQLFLHVSATAIGPNGELLSTDLIECNALNVPPRIFQSR